MYHDGVPPEYDCERQFDQVAVVNRDMLKNRVRLLSICVGLEEEEQSDNNRKLSCCLVS